MIAVQRDVGHAGGLDRWGETPPRPVLFTADRPFFPPEWFAAMRGYIARQGADVVAWCETQRQPYVDNFPHWSTEQHEVSAWVDLIAWQLGIDSTPRPYQINEALLYCWGIESAHVFFEHRGECPGATETKGECPENEGKFDEENKCEEHNAALEYAAN